MEAKVTGNRELRTGNPERDQETAINAKVIR